MWAAAGAQRACMRQLFSIMFFVTLQALHYTTLTIERCITASAVRPKPVF
jgi:hypothetical protein